MATIPSIHGVWDDADTWQDLNVWYDEDQVTFEGNGVNSKPVNFESLNSSGVPVSQGTFEYERLVADSKAVSNTGVDTGAINSRGEPVSQGQFEYERFVADSQSLNYLHLNRLANNGLGIPIDVRPKSDAAIILPLNQRVSVRADSGQMFGLEQVVNDNEPSALIAGIEQETALLGSGKVVDYWQTIQLRQSVDVPESIALFDQAIQRNENSGSIFYLSQRVRDLSQQLQSYHPFEIDLFVTGIGRIADDVLYDSIEINRSEDSAAIMTFSVLVPEGDVTSYMEVQGKLVTLDYTDNDTGVTTRMYTGRIDIPEIDFITGIATYRCTDNRREAINALDQTTVSQWGYYSEDVFGEYPDEMFDQVEQRLETIPYSLDMNRYGGLVLTPWEPKASPNKTLTDADIYRRKPSVQVLSRGRVTNKVRIAMEFQYPRLRYREQPYSFYGANSICAYFDIGPPVKKEMIHEALLNTTWSYKDMRMSDAPCGSSTCGGFSVYRFPCGTYTTHQEPVLDADGKQVLDAKGNPLFETVTDSYKAQYVEYTGSASWTSYIRFAQNISEQISFTVSAPQSIAQYGEVAKDQTMGVKIEYDTKEWEDMKYKYNLSQMTQSPNGDLVYDLAYLDSAKGATRWNDAYNCAVERAKTTILKSHRDNTVSVEVDVLPDLELAHTVQINSTEWTSAKGKVSEIKHTIDLANRDAVTELTLSLSRAIGTPPVTVKPTADAARPQNRTDAPKTVQRITLRTVEIDKDEEITETMVGAIYRQAQYNVLAAFAVNTPEIVEARDGREFKNAVSMEIEIPNNPMTIRHKR